MTCAASHLLDINNGTLTIDAQSGETVFQAFSRHKVFLPSACGGRGKCGLCRVTISSGCPSPTAADQQHLSEAELAAGLRLACQAVVTGSMSITLPDAYYQAANYRVKISKVTHLTDDIVMLRCQAIEPRQMRLEAGAWMFFHSPPSENCPDGVDRPFSIASDTRNQRQLEFIIRRNPAGVCTKWIFECMPVGAEVTLNGPHGDFRLHDGDRPIVFIAGGSGLSAIRSMLYELKQQNSTRKVTVFFGAASCKDLFLLDELTELINSLPNGKFIPAVSKVGDDDDWHGEVGLINAVVERNLQDDDKAEAYLCGSPAMVNACISTLTKMGMPEERIFFDKFV